jgi:photosystem II stability/assembly factor-like uncharacterized protein
VSCLRCSDIGGLPTFSTSETRRVLLVLIAILVSVPSGGLQTAQAQSAEVLEDLQFRNVGPTRGGRSTTVAGHRDQPHTFYMGATGGGVWKTTNYGSSWDNVSDGFFETGSIGSIDVADSDPDVIYVGTGSDGIRSNVIIGRGIYKSTDAGKTWKHMGLRDMGQLASVVVHPTNPEVVYVAALGSPFGAGPERGVYKTVDGGVTWTHLLFVSENTGAVDIELNPANADEVYAAMWTARRYPWSIVSGATSENGIYKSTDAGANWRKIEIGLPDGPTGKIDFAVTPADPTRIYALVEAAPEVEGLYRSNDQGETWRLISNENGLMRRPFYYTNVDADPNDPDVVWVNNEGFFKSTNGGEDWSRVSTPHGDNHDMWINPDNTDIFVQSNDGGANVTFDGGRTWSTQSNQPTAELYQIHADDRFPYWIYAGQQDNFSTIAVPSLPDGSRAGAGVLGEAVGGQLTRHARAVIALDKALEDLPEDDAQRLELESLRSRLVTDNSDSYPPRMIDSQLRYLRGMTTRADQRPGRDAYERLETLTAELNVLIEELERVLGEMEPREPATSDQ